MANDVIWFEVMGEDGAGLRSFYGELFGWRYQLMEESGYGLVQPGEEGIPGGVGQKDGRHVTFYVGTDDIEASLARASELGGRTLMPPTPLPDGARIAMFADPEGNAVGLVQARAA